MLFVKAGPVFRNDIRNVEGVFQPHRYLASGIKHIEMHDVWQGVAFIEVIQKELFPSNQSLPSIHETFGEIGDPFKHSVDLFFGVLGSLHTGEVIGV